MSLMACVNPLSEETGTVEVSPRQVGTSSLIPDIASQVSGYRVTLSQDGETDIVFTKDLADGEGPDPAVIVPDVPTGTWTVLVESLDTAADPAVVVGRSDGSDTVSVSPGGTATVPVTVSPTTDDTGGVEVEITWPETADLEGVQSATWTRASDGSSVDITSSFTPTAPGNGSIFSSLSEPSGEYRLVVRLENAAAIHVATVISSVHIYDNVTTGGSIVLDVGEIARPPLPPTGEQRGFPSTPYQPTRPAMPTRGFCLGRAISIACERRTILAMPPPMW